MSLGWFPTVKNQLSLCNISLSRAPRESATSIMVSCQSVTFMAVSGKSIMEFKAMAIPITSMGMPICAKTMEKPMMKPPDTGIYWKLPCDKMLRY